MYGLFFNQFLIKFQITDTIMNILKSGHRETEVIMKVTETTVDGTGRRPET